MARIRYLGTCWEKKWIKQQTKITCDMSLCWTPTVTVQLSRTKSGKKVALHTAVSDIGHLVPHLSVQYIKEGKFALQLITGNGQREGDTALIHTDKPNRVKKFLSDSNHKHLSHQHAVKDFLNVSADKLFDLCVHHSKDYMFEKSNQ